jgi:hypothetical protein
MLREQTLVMHAEFGALDHGALARPTVTQDRSAARKRLHREMVTRTYVRAREAERAPHPAPSSATRPHHRDRRDGAWGCVRGKGAVR